MFRRRPDLTDTPFVSLGRFPTGVERVEGLLPPSVELWVKREDRAGACYGGNKVRKLEFLLGEAIAQRKTRVVTIGGWGSNHALATARYAQQVGLRCTLHLFPQPMNDEVRAQIVADRATGADVHVASSFLPWLPGLLRDRMSSDAYYIAGGGSSVTGTLGWVSAADEIGEQIERGEVPRPHAVYAALGSGGTVAGLLAGWRGSSSAPDEVTAVRVVERLVCGYGPTRRLEERIVERLQSVYAPLVPLRVVHDQIGAGYGHPTIAGMRAVEAAAGVGLQLDPTYTGKAMAALMADADTGRLDGRRVLFLSTYSATYPRDAV